MRKILCIIVFFTLASAGSGQSKPLPADKDSLAKMLTVAAPAAQPGILEALSDTYRKNFLFDSAIKFRLDAVKLSKELLKKGDTSMRRRVAKNFYAIAYMYISTGQCEQAKDYTEQSRPFISDDHDLAVLYYRFMAESLRQYAQAGAKKISEAEVYYDSLLQTLQKKYPEAGEKLIGIDLGFTSYYTSIADVPNALKYINHADSLAKFYGNDLLRSQTKYMYGDVFAKNNDYVNALVYYKEAEKGAGVWEKGLYVELLRNMAQCYGALGQYENSYKYFMKFAPLRDSIYTKAAENSFAEAEAKFQNKDKQQQIELNNIQLKENRKEKLLMSGGIALLVITALVLVLFYRNKKKTADLLDVNNKKLAGLNNALEAANRTKATLFSIISHDLRSPISQVYQFLKLQQLNPELLDEAQKTSLSNKIQNATGSLLETMEDLLLWSKSQMEEFKPVMQDVNIYEAAERAAGLMQLNIGAKNIRIENSISKSISFKTDPDFLQTVLRNLLQNAVKASPENETIRFTLRDNVLSILNRGEKFSAQDFDAAVQQSKTDKTLHGLGLKLIAELSEKTGLRVTYSEVADGTQAEVHFPNI